MLTRTCRAMSVVFRVDHSVQVRCGIFDVEMLVLARPAFSGHHSATMDVFEITIREFIPSLGILALLLVDPQMPFRIFLESMRSEEFILGLCRRPMLAPCIPFV